MAKREEDLGSIYELDYEEIKTDTHYIKKYNNGRFEAHINEDYTIRPSAGGLSTTIKKISVQTPIEQIIPISTDTIQVSVINPVGSTVENWIGGISLSTSNTRIMFHIYFNTQNITSMTCKINIFMTGYWK